jgi:hypothetical protein
MDGQATKRSSECALTTKHVKTKRRMTKRRKTETPPEVFLTMYMSLSLQGILLGLHGMSNTLYTFLDLPSILQLLSTCRDGRRYQLSVRPFESMLRGHGVPKPASLLDGRMPKHPVKSPSTTVVTTCHAMAHLMRPYNPWWWENDLGDVTDFYVRVDPVKLKDKMEKQSVRIDTVDKKMEKLRKRMEKLEEQMEKLEWNRTVFERDYTRMSASMPLSILRRQTRKALKHIYAVNKARKSKAKTPPPPPLPMPLAPPPLHGV